MSLYTSDSLVTGEELRNPSPELVSALRISLIEDIRAYLTRYALGELPEDQEEEILAEVRIPVSDGLLHSWVLKYLEYNGDHPDFMEEVCQVAAALHTEILKSENFGRGPFSDIQRKLNKESMPYWCAAEEDSVPHLKEIVSILQEHIPALEVITIYHTRSIMTFIAITLESLKGEELHEFLAMECCRRFGASTSQAKLVADKLYALSK